VASEPATSRDRLLYEVAAELTSSLDLDEVLGRLMDRVIELTHAARGFVVLVNPVTGTMQVRVARGAAEEELAREFLGSRTVIDTVMAAGVAVLTSNATLDSRFMIQESVVMQSLRSIIAVPLLAKGRVVGALYVDNPLRAGIFSESDRDFLQAMADMAAIAIENAVTFEHAETLRRTFERYVNKQVMEWVLAQPDRDQVFLPGRRLRVTMLNTDIARFSVLSREMRAEQLVQLLNLYFERMVEVVLRNGGNVNKFQGDGLLAVFGAPVPMEDSAARAVAAAQELVASVADLNAERGRAGGAPLHVGIGLDTGEVVAGNVGSELRLEYTLIGVPVNNASFLSKVRPPAVLLSDSTYRALGGSVPVIERPPLELKGGGPVPVYTLPPVL
jgi:adenylate cyclase